MDCFQGIPSNVKVSFHLAKMGFHVVKPLPITKLGVDLVFVVEGVTKTVVVCFVSDPLVKLVIVYIGEGVLCRRLDSGRVHLF